MSPKEALALPKVAKGDFGSLMESPDGVRITPYSPDFGGTDDVGAQLYA